LRRPLGRADHAAESLTANKYGAIDKDIRPSGSARAARNRSTTGAGGRTLCWQYLIVVDPLDQPAHNLARVERIRHYYGLDGTPGSGLVVQRGKLLRHFGVVDVAPDNGVVEFELPAPDFDLDIPLGLRFIGFNPNWTVGQFRVEGHSTGFYTRGKNVYRNLATDDRDMVHLAVYTKGVAMTFHLRPCLRWSTDFRVARFRSEPFAVFRVTMSLDEMKYVDAYVNAGVKLDYLLHVGRGQDSLTEGHSRSASKERAMPPMLASVYRIVSATRRLFPDAGWVLLIVCGLFPCADCLLGAACCPLQGAEKPALRTAGSVCAVGDRFVPADVRQVRLGGEIGRRVEITLRNNLLQIDVESVFFKPYREKKEKPGSFIGLGKLIDSFVRFAAHTGDPQVLQRKQWVIQQTIGLQEPDGYIGYFPPELRMWTLWDTYDMGYLVYGLATDYACFGQEQSLAAARKLADYMIARVKAEPQRAARGIGGLSDWCKFGFEGYLLLHRCTLDPRYWDFCVKDCRLPQWDVQVLLDRRVSGHRSHVAGYCLGARIQLWAHRLDPSPKLLEGTHRALEFLTRQDGLAVIGTSGVGEHWDRSQASPADFGETCATAHLLWLLEDLLRLEGDARYGDLIERAVYNALFAAQSPDGRRLRYFIPFEGPRQYFARDDYCCPCNYRRIVADLPGMVCYGCDGGLVVNLYTASEATVPLDGGKRLAVRQRTDYPSSGRVALHLDPSEETEFPLRLRIPRWCRGAKAAVNGQPVDEAARPGSFLVLKRRWKVGDHVDLDLPMSWRLVKGRRAQAGRAAVMRGPLVFCLNRNRQESVALPKDLRTLVIDPTSLEGPVPDNSVRPDGLACRVRAFRPGSRPPSAKAELGLLLTEFPDPDGEATFVLVPDHAAPEPVDDELL